MVTQQWKINSKEPDAAIIQTVAEKIISGEIIALPTETVYGLAADGLNAEAVKKIFTAKGRPAANPVILHVNDVEQAKVLSAEWPMVADKLAAAFWPGPLTIVVKKANHVPNIVTANGPTVAIRCPSHAVMRAVIQAVGKPLAAPSANRSNQLSPTKAEHVVKALDGLIDGVVDAVAGACDVGIESTVVDCTVSPPKILRPGTISQSQIQAVIGSCNYSLTSSVQDMQKSPGLMLKHYSPKTPLFLVDSPSIAFDKCLADQARNIKTKSLGISDGNSMADYQFPDSPTEYAAKLYDFLHQADNGREIDRLVIEMPPDTPEWAGVRDRLYRAAGVAPVVFVPKEDKKRWKPRWDGDRREGEFAPPPNARLGRDSARRHDGRRDDGRSGR